MSVRLSSPYATPFHLPLCFLGQTTKAHITVLGGVVEELVADAGLVVTSDNPFKVRGEGPRRAAC